MFRRRLKAPAASAEPKSEQNAANDPKRSSQIHNRFVDHRLYILAAVVILSISIFTRSVSLGNHSSSSVTSETKSWFDVPRKKFAIVQFDGRSPWNVDQIGPTTWRYIPTIHNTGSIWNYLYSKKHGHEYILYHWGEGSQSSCLSEKNQTLAEAWCKLIAMMKAQTLFPEADYFLYLDTDAVVDMQFYNQSLNHLFYNMTHQWQLNWTIDEKPFTLNMEGPSYWCKRTNEAKFKNCINTGTVLWKRSDLSTRILRKWWQSADDSYEINNPMGYKFRTETPWEQVKAQYLLNDPLNKYIQVVPQPHAGMQGLPGIHKGYCLSDCWLPPMWEQLGCFVLHYCMKKGMVETYGSLLREHLEKHNISHSEACYPRSVITPRSKLEDHSVDVAPCHPEWIGYGEQIVQG